MNPNLVVESQKVLSVREFGNIPYTPDNEMLDACGGDISYNASKNSAAR